MGFDDTVIDLVADLRGYEAPAGVGERAARAGVAIEVMARASELLRDAGTRACHIGWTRRERFYSRLGYTPWRRYHMARRPLAG